MPAFIDEQQSFQDVNGKPIVNGFIFIGVAGSVPTIPSNQIPIFSDRALQTGIANPQRTDTFGKSVSKIFIPARFSVIVQDVDSVQKFIDLDSGSSPSVGITSLTNIQGTNVITASADPTLTAYEDKQQFTLTIVVSPTGAVTIDIDGVGPRDLQAKAIPIQPGQLPVNQLIVFAFNIDLDVFELISSGGDVIGPIISVAGRVATFLDATGKIIQDSAKLLSDLVTGPGTPPNNVISLFSGASNTIKASSLSENQIGKVLQVVQADFGARVTTTVDFSSTAIPTTSSGAQFMSLVITPKFSNSILHVDVVIQGFTSSTVHSAAALFKDSIVNGIAGSVMFHSAGGQGSVLMFSLKITAGTTSAQTFKVRAGSQGASTYAFNGDEGGTVALGGIPKSSIKITEVRV